MRIAVTTFYSKSYLPLAEITTEILKKYCNRHGYELFIHEIEDNESFHFVKTQDALNALNDGYDIVFAIENDILITNLTMPIETFIDNDHELFYCHDINGHNTGTFIIKNSQWSKNILNEINERRFMTLRYGDEQNVIEQIRDNRIKYLPHPSINSIPYEYYAPSYGYINWEQYNPRKEKPTHEMGCWQKGDFCMHLPGMTLNRRIEIFQQHLKDIIYE